MKTISKIIATSCAVFGLGLMAAPAMAGRPITVPEPSVLSLLGVGAVIGLAILIRNRRK